MRIMQSVLYVILCTCLLCCIGKIQAQTADSVVNKLPVTGIDSKTLSGLEKQYTGLQSKLNKKSAKLLSSMQKKESKLNKKLGKADSLKAKALFTEDIKKQYADLQSDLTKTTEKLKRFPLKEYVPGIDSMQTALGFLSKNSMLPPGKLEQIQSLNSQLKSLQNELQKANDIQAFVREREAQLKEQLLNTGLAKQLKGINKEVYYYQAQLQEYKALLNDKDKLAQRLLETVRTLPAFQKFWQKNSYLAALFPAPSNSSVGGSIVGLQTRASVQASINQRMGLSSNSNPTITNGSGANPLQQQLDAAQAQLNQLKNKLNKFSNGSGRSDMTMPDFKPNDQKTKSFLQRLEYGLNVQSQPGRYSSPAMSDVALTLGYKLSDTKRFGLGASYKVGWGDIHHILVSSEGVGFRSYVDIKVPPVAKGKILGGLWFSGGFEYNYLSSFRSIQELHENVDVWQRSARLGISKKYKVKKKECSMQLLYDFLHNQQIPPGTALKFRVGYNF
jgi:hypothetical protein